MAEPMFELPGQVESTARISLDGNYRYSLTRRWSPAPRAVWIMLNPSTADASVDDPTIRRCRGFSQAWGCGALEVVNLYAWRATQPSELLIPGRDVVGRENDEAITRAVAGADTIVAAWGVNAGAERSEHVAALVKRAGGFLQCLGTTKGGQPRHPLYVRADKALEPFTLEVARG